MLALKRPKKKRGGSIHRMERRAGVGTAGPDAWSWRNPGREAAWKSVTPATMSNPRLRGVYRQPNP